MDETFDEQERLLRAVYPADRKPDFWRTGRLSSAALKDKRGLSVTRTYDKPLQEAVTWVAKRLQGFVVSITVASCNEVKAYVIYCPSTANPYHSEIHGSEREIELSDLQAYKLARQARIEHSPSIDANGNSSIAY